jgi:tetratricopeptide (TPR) repeat protein
MADSEAAEARLLDAESVLASDEGFSDPAARVRMSVALVEKGEALVELGREDVALGAFERAGNEFQESLPADFRERLAVAVLDLASSVVDENPVEAMWRFDELAEWFAGSVPSEPPGVLLARLDEGVLACDSVVSQFGAREDIASRVSVVEALRIKSRLLAIGGHGSDALAVSVGLLARFEGASAPELRVPLGLAMYDAGRLFNAAGRSEEAIELWSQVAERFAIERSDRVPFIRLDALYAKGRLLSQLGRCSEAVAVSDEMIAAYGSEDSLVAQLSIAAALSYTSDCLAKAGRGDDVLAMSDQLLTRFGAATDPELRGRVSYALLRKAWSFREAGRINDAIVVTDSLIARFEQENDTPILAQMGELLLALSKHFLVQKRSPVSRLWQGRPDQGLYEEALRICDVLIDGGGGVEDPDLSRIWVKAHIERAGALRLLGQKDEAEAAEREVFSLGEPAIAAFEEMASDAQQRSDRNARLYIAAALMSRAIAIDVQDNNEAALGAFNDVIEQFKSDRAPPIKLIVAAARDVREQLLAEDDSS